MSTLSHHTAALLVAAGAVLVAAATAHAQAARTPETDQTVAASKGMQLFVNNFAGEVVVRAWPQEQVRVQARHSGRVRVNVRTVDNAIRVGSTGSTGTSSVDYDIRVPAWMPVRVNG